MVPYGFKRQFLKGRSIFTRSANFIRYLFFLYETKAVTVSLVDVQLQKKIIGGFKRSDFFFFFEEE